MGDQNINRTSFITLAVIDSRRLTHVRHRSFLEFLCEVEDLPVAQTFIVSGVEPLVVNIHGSRTPVDRSY